MKENSARQFSRGDKGARRAAATKPSPARSLLVTTALTAVCAVVGLSAAGGTYAFLNAKTSVGGATIKAGSMSLQVNDAGTSTIEDATVAPQSPVAKPFTVTNVGSVPVTLDAAITATSSLDINSYTRALITPVANAAACATGLTGTRAVLPGYSRTGLDTLTPGQKKTYCLERSLADNTPVALSGQSVSFTLTMTSNQKQ